MSQANARSAAECHDFVIEARQRKGSEAKKQKKTKRRRRSPRIFLRKGESSVDGADDRARKDERSEDGIAPQKKARHDFVIEARQRKGSEAKKQKN